jgi:hypothetical protein
MATRPIRFELHIRPLMRLIDRDSMAFRFDLWDYDDVKANADKILLRTNVDMPPMPYGGPWPAEWVATFQRWKDEGFLRLDLGTPDAAGYQATESAGQVTLTCRGTTPTGEYRAWFDTIVPEGAFREFVLYWEPPVPSTPATPTPFRARRTFQPATGQTQLAVTDSVGRHIIPFTPAPAPLLVAADISDVQPVLESLGASHIETISMVNGVQSRFQFKSRQFDVFSDVFGVEIEAPPALHAEIKASLSAVQRSKLPPK